MRSKKRRNKKRGKNNVSATTPKDKTAPHSTGQVVWIVWIVAVVVGYFFFLTSSEQILNYPREVFRAALFGVGAGVVLWQWKGDVASFRDWDKDWVSRAVWAGVLLCKAAIITWFTTGIVLLPFNYYNLYRAKEGQRTMDSVAIAGVTRRKDQVSFWYKGRLNTLGGHRRLLDSISANRDMSHFRVALHLNEGLLGSYVVNDWSIVLR